MRFSFFKDSFTYLKKKNKHHLHGRHCSRCLKFVSKLNSKCPTLMELAVWWGETDNEKSVHNKEVYYYTGN